MAAIVTRVLVALAVIFYGPERGCPSSSPAILPVTTPTPLNNVCPVLLPIQLSYFTPLSFVLPPTINTSPATNPKALPLNVCANLLPIERLVPLVAVTTINDIAAAFGHAGPGGCIRRGNADAAYREDYCSPGYRNPHYPQTPTRLIPAPWTNPLVLFTLIIAIQLFIIIHQSRRLRRADEKFLNEKRTVLTLLDDNLEYADELSSQYELVADLRKTITQKGELYNKAMEANCKRLRGFVTCSQLLYGWKIRSRDTIIERLKARLARALKDLQDMTGTKDAQLKAAKTNSDLEAQELRNTILNRDLQVGDLKAQLVQNADDFAEMVETKDDETRAAQKELREKNDYIQRTTDNMKHIILQKEEDIELLTTTILDLEEELDLQLEFAVSLQGDRQMAIEGSEAARQDNTQLREECQKLQNQLRRRSLDVKELGELRESNVELMDLITELMDHVDWLEEQEVASAPLTPAMTIGDASPTFSGPSEVASNAPAETTQS